MMKSDAACMHLRHVMGSLFALASALAGCLVLSLDQGMRLNPTLDQFSGHYSVSGQPASF
jgi:hypothetical protein